MRGLRKKAVVLAAVAALAMSSLTGCSGDYAVDNNKVAVTVGDSEITLGALNFYLRYDQSGIEQVYGSALGDGFWKIEVTEGCTFEENEKESLINAMTQMCILEDHMSELGVSLSADELSKIEKAADAFIAANAEEARALVSGEKDIIVDVLKMCTISKLTYEEIIKDVSTEVADADAAQKKLAYLGFTKSSTLTLEQAKAEAELFLKEAKESGDMVKLATEQQAPVHEYTFDSKTTELSKEIVAAADKLKEGEFAELLQVDDKYYVVQLISEFDKDATEAKKASIVAERQDKKFQEVYKPWKEATKVVINDKAIEEISLHGLKVNMLEKKEQK